MPLTADTVDGSGNPVSEPPPAPVSKRRRELYRARLDITYVDGITDHAVEFDTIADCLDEAISIMREVLPGSNQSGRGVVGVEVLACITVQTKPLVFRD